MSNKLNHFMEIQRGDDAHIWLMVHSGSRNLGKKVADHYIKLANENVASSDVYVPKNWELDYLDAKSPEGRAYLGEMNYCLEFAATNRAIMVNTMLNILKEEIPRTLGDQFYDIHHNYASLEHHYNRDVWIHRKGATSANKGQIGIIPGSQGTASYIVEGRGNPNSFMSCSHGSGRLMGRGDAKRRLSLEDERQKLDIQGIIHDMNSVGALDEAPGAYKDIELVMNQQLDLVKPLVRLTPLAVIKG